MLEQEVKLEFTSAEAARRSIVSAGARLVVSRRLLDDRLYDTADGGLRRDGTALRVRRDGAKTRLTFKGAVQPGPVKIREELETDLGDPAVGDALLRALGYRPGFRAQKYREEYALGDAIVTIDETPIGVFVEIEGAPADIERTTVALGKTRADYRLESYGRLYLQWCDARGISPGDMIFGAPLT